MENIVKIKKSKSSEEAIILAGGYGKRLGTITKKIPKPMIKINGTPFLEGLINYLITQKIKKVFLSLSYKYNIIKNYFNQNEYNIEIDYSIEKQPLGTGGAIGLAIKKTSSENIFVFNGDSFFDIDLKTLYMMHKRNKSDISLALKYKNNNERYGNVVINNQSKIIEFSEKQKTFSNFVNGGVYIINKKKYLKHLSSFPDKFSFEKEFLPYIITKINVFGFIFKGYFIDIGIPEDLKKAEEEINKFFYWKNDKKND